MKYVAALVGAASVVLSVSAAVGSGAAGWGLTLVGCFLLGMAGTGAALRWRAHTRARAMAQAVAAGHILWGAQVRETRGGGRWGVSGRLLLEARSWLELIPDGPSRKRGAVDQSWDRGQVTLAVLARKRDITGLPYTVLELRPSTGAIRRFAAFDLRGQLPQELEAQRSLS